MFPIPKMNNISSITLNGATNVLLKDIVIELTVDGTTMAVIPATFHMNTTLPLGDSGRVMFKILDKQQSFKKYGWDGKIESFIGKINPHQINVKTSTESNDKGVTEFQIYENDDPEEEGQTSRLDCLPIEMDPRMEIKKDDGGWITKKSKEKDVVDLTENDHENDEDLHMFDELFEKNFKENDNVNESSEPETSSVATESESNDHDTDDIIDIDSGDDDYMPSPKQETKREREDEIIQTPKKENAKKKRRLSAERFELTMEPVSKEYCFNTSFLTDSAIVPLNKNSGRSETANNGMFGDWEVAGLKKANDQGFNAQIWQVESLELALYSYTGENVTFGSYGGNIWMSMGLGKTWPTLTAAIIMARLPLPGKAIPATIDERTRLHSYTSSMIKDEDQRRLFNMNMFVSSMTRFLPLHEFTGIENRGHALIVIPKSIIDSWTGDILKFFDLGKIPYIDLIHNIDLYRTGTLLKDRLPTVLFVIIGESMLSTIKKNIQKHSKYRYTEEILNDDKKNKVRKLPPFKSRKGKLYNEGLNVIFSTAWNMLVFDEAHIRRNSMSAKFKASMDLMAHQRICLTGTPLHNKLTDIQSLFMMTGMSHCAIDDKREYGYIVDVYREREKKKATVKMIEDLGNQFESRITAICSGQRAIKKEQLVAHIKDMVRIKSINDYNPFKSLNNLYIVNLQTALNEKVIPLLDSNTKFSKFEYDLSDYIFDLYKEYKNGRFGKNGEDMLTIKYPLIHGKAEAYSGRTDSANRADHIAIFKKKANRPEWLDNIVKLGVMKETSEQQNEINKLRNSISMYKEMINGGLLPPNCVPIHEEHIKTMEKEIEQISKSLGICNDVKEFEKLWKIENMLLYSMFVSYDSVATIYKPEEQEKFDWNAACTLPIMDNVTLGINIFHRFTANETFRKIWKNAEMDTTWYTDAFSNSAFTSYKKDSAEEIMRAIQADQFGFILNRCVKRYGKDTYYKSELKKAIEQAKITKGGMDLDAKELKEIDSQMFNKYGVQELVIKSEFLYDYEKKIYSSIQRNSIKEVKDMLDNEDSAKLAYMSILKLIMAMRQAAVDCRLLGFSVNYKNMLEADKEAGVIDLDVTDFGDENDDSNVSNSAYGKEILEQISMITNTTKLKLLRDTLTNPNVVNPNDKIIIFTYFVQNVKYIGKLLDEIYGEGSWVYIDGSLNQEDRTIAINKYSTEPNVKAFISTFGSGSLGLNLQMGCFVFLMDPWWNPCTEEQAIDRANRIGKTKMTTVVRFIIKNTIEEKVQLIQQAKQDLFDVILGSIDKPCILPTNNDLNQIGKINVKTMIELIDSEGKSGISQTFEDVVKKRNANKANLKNKPKKLTLKKRKTTNEKQDVSKINKINEPHNWIVRNNSGTLPKLTKENFDNVVNQLASSSDNAFNI